MTRGKKHGRSTIEPGEKTVSHISCSFQNFQKRGEEMENGFGESNPLFYDRIRFVTEGK